jgi:hypothetical protein
VTGWLDVYLEFKITYNTMIIKNLFMDNPLDAGATEGCGASAALAATIY